MDNKVSGEAAELAKDRGDRLNFLRDVTSKTSTADRSLAVELLEVTVWYQNTCM